MFLVLCLCSPVNLSIYYSHSSKQGLDLAYSLRRKISAAPQFTASQNGRFNRPIAALEALQIAQRPSRRRSPHTNEFVLSPRYVPFAVPIKLCKRVAEDVRGYIALCRGFVVKIFAREEVQTIVF